MSERTTGFSGRVFVVTGSTQGIGAEVVIALARASAKSRDRTTVIVIDTDPAASTGDGGAWWDVAVAETSENEGVNAAREAYVKATGRQRVGN